MILFYRRTDCHGRKRPRNDVVKRQLSNNLSSLDFDGFAQLGKPAGFAAGDEHLSLGNLIQNKILPACIQFRQNIIQQKYGELTGLFPHQFSLGKL